MVDARTDLVPGREFSTVRTTINAPGGDRGPSELEAGTRDFFGGVRVAEFEGLSAGDLSLRVELRDAAGALVAARPVDVRFSGQNSVVTVVLTRDCVEVTCPLATGDPGATACLGGRCVPPGCVEESPESCGVAQCVAAADCTAGGADCPSVACSASGACLYGECAEQCNGLDDDGDGSVDEHALDEDGDGTDSCDDCDDSDPRSAPGLTETCSDGVDNDCSGAPETAEECCASGSTLLHADDTPQGHSVCYSDLRAAASCGNAIADCLGLTTGAGCPLLQDYQEEVIPTCDEMPQFWTEPAFPVRVNSRCTAATFIPNGPASCRWAAEERPETELYPYRCGAPPLLPAHATCVRHADCQAGYVCAGDSCIRDSAAFCCRDEDCDPGTPCSSFRCCASDSVGAGGACEGP